MTYAERGKNTSDAVEVTSISRHGIHMTIGGREFSLAFDSFPWFREATVGQILHVESPGQGRLRWPELDVDLSVESIEHPERFPLVSKNRSEV